MTLDTLCSVAGLLLLLALVVMLPRLGDSYLTRVQKIALAGIKLEVSILSLLFLVGLCLVSTGLIFRYKNYEAQIADLATWPPRLEAVEKRHRADLARARQVDIVALVTLAGLPPEQAPEPKELECTLSLHGAQQSVQLQVTAGYQPLQYSVLLEDLTAERRIRALQCRVANQTWSLDQFSPLEPEYELRRK